MILAHLTMSLLSDGRLTLNIKSMIDIKPTTNDFLLVLWIQFEVLHIL